MISTITTAVSTIVSGYTGIIVSLGAAGVLTLIGALVVKELAAAGGVRARSLGRNLDVVVLPLTFVLFFIIIMKVLDILG